MMNSLWAKCNCLYFGEKNPKESEVIVMADKKKSSQKQKESSWKNGVFGKVFGFFKGIGEKIKEFFNDVFNRAPKDTTPQWKDQPKDNTYKPSDQIYEEEVHFPGYDDLQVQENGLVRIPSTNAQLWDVSDAQRYLNCIHEKIPVMPNPIEEHNGEFVGAVSSDIYKAMKQETNQTLIYAVADKLLTAKIENGACTVTLADGKSSASLELRDPMHPNADLAAFFAWQLSTDGKSYMIDTQKGIRYAQWLKENGELASFVIEKHHPHVNNYEGKAFVIHKQSLDGVLEIQGTEPMPRHFIDEALKVDTEMSQQDFRYMTTALYEQVMGLSSGHSTFVTQDKVFWISEQNGKQFINVAPTQCKHQNVPTYTVPIPDKALETPPSRDGCKALSRTIDKTITKLNEHLEKLDQLEQEADKAANAAKDAESKRNENAQDQTRDNDNTTPPDNDAPGDTPNDTAPDDSNAGEAEIDDDAIDEMFDL